MKSIWKGSISFGLVTIPVNLYGAVESHVLGFKMLHDKCKTPISNKRWCTHCNEEIPYEHVVKGLKLEDGSYFIATPEKIKELKPEKTDLISIVEFVPVAKLEMIYLDHHYYIGPSKQGEKAFFLFQQALEKTNKVAIGTFVLRDKEYVCSITSYEHLLLLTTLNYIYEIRDAASIVDEKMIPKITQAELTLANTLIEQLTQKTFDMSQFKDTFAQKLKEAVKKGKKIKAPKPQKPPVRKKEESLIDALRASLMKPQRAHREPVARAGAKKKPTKVAK